MLLFILPSKLADQKVEIFFFFSSVFIPLCSRGVGCLPLTEILCTSPPPPPFLHSAQPFVQCGSHKALSHCWVGAAGAATQRGLGGGRAMGQGEMVA